MANINYGPFQLAWAGAANYVNTTLDIRPFNGGTLGVSVYSDSTNTGSGGGTFVVPDATFSPGDYKVFIRHNSDVGGDPTAEHVFTWHEITQPVITSPSDGSILSTLEPTFTASAFQVQPSNNNITHVSSDWYVKDQATGTTVYQSVNDTTNLTSITLPAGVLTYGKTYIVYVRYNTNFFPSRYSDNTYAVSAPPGILGAPSFRFNSSPDSIYQNFNLEFDPFTDSPTNTFSSVTASTEILDDQGSVLIGPSYTALDRNATRNYVYNNIGFVLPNAGNYVVRVRYQSTLNGVTYYTDYVEVLTSIGDNPNAGTRRNNVFANAKGLMGNAQLPDGRTLLVGGANRYNSTTGVTSSAWLANKDFTTFTPMTQYWSTRMGMAAVAIDYYRVLMTGGKSNDSSGVAKLTYIFDVRTNTWTRVADLLARRYASAICKLPNGKILLHGGAYWNGSLSRLEYSSATYLYDVELNTWTALGNGPFRAAYHKLLTTKDGKVYCFFGETGVTGGVNTKQVYEYDYETDTWAFVTNMILGSTNTTFQSKPISAVELRDGVIAIKAGNGLIYWNPYINTWSPYKYSGQVAYNGLLFADSMGKTYNVAYISSGNNWAGTLSTNILEQITETYRDITISTIGDNDVADPTCAFKIIAKAAVANTYYTVKISLKDPLGNEVLNSFTGSPTPVPYDSTNVNTSNYYLPAGGFTSRYMTDVPEWYDVEAFFTDNQGLDSHLYKKRIYMDKDAYDLVSISVSTPTNYSGGAGAEKGAILDNGTYVSVGRNTDTAANTSADGFFVLDTNTLASTFYPAAPAIPNSLLTGAQIFVSHGNDAYLLKVNTLFPDDSFYKFTASTGTITQLGPAPFVPSYNGSGFKIDNDKILFCFDRVQIGGVNTDNTSWIYTPSTDTWTRVSDYYTLTASDPAGLYIRSPTVTVDNNGRVVLFGWYMNNYVYSFISVYDPVTDTWTQHTDSKAYDSSGVPRGVPGISGGASFDRFNIARRVSVSRNISGTATVSCVSAYAGSVPEDISGTIDSAITNVIYRVTDIPYPYTDNFAMYGKTIILPNGNARVYSANGVAEVTLPKALTPYMPKP